MSSKFTQQPVLPALPVAYWVNGDVGLKQTPEAALSGIDLVAEEVAVMVPCGEAVLDDADYDIWDELREPIAEAFAVKLDAANPGGRGEASELVQAVAACTSPVQHQFASQSARRLAVAPARRPEVAPLRVGCFPVVMLPDVGVVVPRAR